MATSPAMKDHLDILHKYTACDIADALLKLKVPNAGFLPDLTLKTPTSNPDIVIAPASTVLFVWKDGRDVADYPPANIPAGKHYIDLTEPGTILVSKQPEGQKCAVLGGIMAQRLKVLDAKGVVISGRCRDVQELAETGLPIWARATSIVGTGAEAKAHAVQVPLDLGGTVVRPGDLVFGDPINGVVVIPISKVSEVVDLLPRLVAADDRVKEDVLKGVTVQEAFAKHRS